MCYTINTQTKQQLEKTNTVRFSCVGFETVTRIPHSAVGSAEVC